MARDLTSVIDARAEIWGAHSARNEPGGESWARMGSMQGSLRLAAVGACLAALSCSSQSTNSPGASGGASGASSGGTSAAGGSGGGTGATDAGSGATGGVDSGMGATGGASGSAGAGGGAGSCAGDVVPDEICSQVKTSASAVYFICHSADPVSWDVARKSCQKKCMDLAIVSSTAENEVLAKNDSNSNKWIGLRRNTNSELEWVDGSTLDPQVFPPPWADLNEPSAGNSGQDCVYVNSVVLPDYPWSDTECTGKQFGNGNAQVRGWACE